MYLPFRFPGNLLFLLLPSCLLFHAYSTGSAKQPGDFELFDGDRVVFVGNTFIERAVEYGHIEAALTTRWPERNLTFRNLGWSGDDARGRARRFFGTVEDGFKHLTDHVNGLKPTVIFVSYGAMESYEGRAGIKDFESNMNRLLDALIATRARIVVISPIPQENMGPPLPDPIEQNRNLGLYANSLETLAAKRGFWFVDLFSFFQKEMEKSSAPLTDNGIHLNDRGYRLAARGVLSGLGIAFPGKSIRLDARGNLLALSGTRPTQIQPLGNGLLLTLRDDTLSGAEPLTLSVRDLFAGIYTLRLNGRNLGSFPSGQWGTGVKLPWTPGDEQEQLLLQTIRKKNKFYFYKWRPQNETYLRGFRSHEQGQNAAELEEFDYYIEREEAKIADLKQPRIYTLNLQRETEK